MTVAFVTPGPFDMRALTVFGASVKKTDNPIGYFGTGLKYAIAVLLRHSVAVSLDTADDVWDFSTREEAMRDTPFPFVYMTSRSSGEQRPLPFTTELGKDWELWMAYRELASNTKDEGGRVHKSAHAPAGKTTFLVDHADFDQVHEDRHTIFLDGIEPIWKGKDTEVYKGNASKWVYYRGIRCGKLDRDSLYTYNITSKIDLTEDRTFKYAYQVEQSLINVVRTLEDTKMLRRILTATDNYAEAKFNLRYGTVAPSDAFTQTVQQLIADGVPHLNATAYGWYRDHYGKCPKPSETKIDQVDKSRLERAVRFCESLGYPVRSYPIRTYKPADTNMLGLAVDDEIWISTEAFQKGTKMVAGTLIEEYLHIRHRLMDETRQMQNFLIDTIVSLGERVTGEAL